MSLWWAWKYPLTKAAFFCNAGGWKLYWRGIVIGNYAFGVTWKEREETHGQQ
jgi:hypothetical protein